MVLAFSCNATADRTGTIFFGDSEVEIDDRGDDTTGRLFQFASVLSNGGIANQSIGDTIAIYAAFANEEGYQPTSHIAIKWETGEGEINWDPPVYSGTTISSSWLWEVEVKAKGWAKAYVFIKAENGTVDYRSEKIYFGDEENATDPPVIPDDPDLNDRDNKTSIFSDPVQWAQDNLIYIVAFIILLIVGWLVGGIAGLIFSLLGLLIIVLAALGLMPQIDILGMIT